MAISKKLVKLIIERDNGLCQLSLAGCMVEASVADHRAPRGMGGSKALDRPSALVAACWLCNQAREDSSGEDREQLVARGVIVMKAATNHQTALRALETPFVDLAGIAWLLDDEGGKERA